MLIDAFTYFNEEELVELRLKYLNSIVDYFIVIESNITFTGKEKKWNFPDILKNFVFLGKIILTVVSHL